MAPKYKSEDNIGMDLIFELDKFLLKMPLNKKLLIALQHGFEMPKKFEGVNWEEEDEDELM